MGLQWGNFSDKFSCSDFQMEQLELFHQQLVEWNSRMNLTALTEFRDVREYHFADSLHLGRFIDFKKYRGLVDIGSGAGFPGLPIKIMYPDLPIILIEVMQKRRRFLAEMVDVLGLSGVEIVSADWQTFVHTTTFEHNLFCARASLRPEDLVIMFKGRSPYKKADLVYWASEHWTCSDIVRPYHVRDYQYMVGERNRKYIYCKKK